MRKKIVGIFVLILLIATALSAAGNVKNKIIDNKVSNGFYKQELSPIISNDCYSNWSFNTKVSPSDSMYNDNFGKYVSISNNYAIIGAPSEYDTIGSAYIFKNVDGGWFEDIKLTAPDGEYYDFFGSSVSINGDYAIVGAIGDDGWKGSAYIFKLVDSTWIYQTKLTASDGESDDYFGISVSIDKYHAVIGARFHDNGKGAVYVFSCIDSTWEEEIKLQASDGESDDLFGTSVSLDNEYIIAGARGDDLQRGSVYVFKHDGKSWVEEEKLQASDGYSGDWFGESVSLDRNRFIVGAKHDDDQGSAYIFRQNGDNWFEEQKLFDSDGQYGDWFGQSVSISGYFAVVSSLKDDDNGINFGSAFVFRRSGSFWTEETKVFGYDLETWVSYGWSVSIDGKYAIVGAEGNPNPGHEGGAAYIYHHYPMSLSKLLAVDVEANDSFGYSVSLDGDTALIGAPWDDDNGEISGSVYVFTRSGNVWSEQDKLLPSDGAERDWFGWSVSLDGESALIGSRGSDGNEINSGSAYVFTRNGNVWTEQDKLMASDGEEADGFGWSVSLDGDTALIGANWDDDNEEHSGSAYVFTRSGSTWSEQDKILPLDGERWDYFGQSVSLDGDTALIGSSWDDDNGASSGSAYVFTRSGNVWSEQEKLLPSDGAEWDHFGCSVSLDGDAALIGASEDDDNGLSSGSAYLFTRSGSTWTEQDKLLPLDGTDQVEFGDSVSLDGDTALIGTRWDDDNGWASGSAYVFTRSGNVWSEKEKLLPSDGAEWDWFGFSISLDGNSALIGAPQDDDNGEDSGSVYIFEKSIGDLFCDGSLSWTDVEPVEYLEGFFTVENIGRSCSFLNWEIDSYPDWGYWGFTSYHGYIPYGESEIIDVQIIAPSDKNQEFTGEIKIVNKDNSSDFELIPVYLKTPRTRTVYHPLLMRLFDHFPLLERLLNPFWK